MISVKRHRAEVSEEIVHRFGEGDARATDSLYAVLKAKFLGVALRILRDEHEAQEAFHDSFLKLQARVMGDGFEWQGEARFYSYFGRILTSVCNDHYRRNKPRREWEDKHLVPSQEPVDKKDEDEELIERVERVADDDGDPHNQEVEAQRRGQFLGELAAYLQEALTPTERCFWEAYRELVCTPGSDDWGSHQKTALLKELMGMSGSRRFYSAHSRFKEKLERFIQQTGIEFGIRLKDFPRVRR